MNPLVRHIIKRVSMVMALMLVISSFPASVGAADIISITVPISVVTNDTTPSFTITAHEKADLTYSNCQGDLSSINKNQVKVIMLSALADGTYSNCTIHAQQTTGPQPRPNEDEIHATFTIDTQKPVISITAPTMTETNEITDTTIQVTDNYGIDASSVIIAGSAKPVL